MVRFCLSFLLYIGKRRLEQALEKFPQKDEVEVEFRSYELDPTTAKNQDKTIHEALAMKYGMSVDEAKKMNEGVGEQAKGVGLNFQFDTMVPANTFDAHRLAHFAKTKAKDKEITERLLHAYFTEGKRLSDHDVLAELAVEVGLERNEVFEVLQDETAYADDVRYDENTAQQIGVRGVPFFVVNQKYAISGVHSQWKHLWGHWRKYGKRKRQLRYYKNYQVMQMMRLVSMEIV